MTDSQVEVEIHRRNICFVEVWKSPKYLMLPMVLMEVHGTERIAEVSYQTPENIRHLVKKRNQRLETDSRRKSKCCWHMGTLSLQTTMQQ